MLREKISKVKSLAKNNIELFNKLLSEFLEEYLTDKEKSAHILKEFLKILDEKSKIKLQQHWKTMSNSVITQLSIMLPGIPEIINAYAQSTAETVYKEYVATPVKR